MGDEQFTGTIGISFDDVLVDGAVLQEPEDKIPSSNLNFYFDNGQALVLRFPTPEKLKEFCTKHNFPLTDYRG